MAKVLLVYANTFMDNLVPVGVSLLSACLKKAGHKTKLFDTTFYRTKDKTGDEARAETLQIKETNLEEYGISEKKTDMLDDFKRLVSEFNPDIVAISVVEVSYLIGLRLLKSIKFSRALKVMGGIHVTMSADEVIKEECVDIACVGEGERALVELAERIDRGINYFNIDNLWIKRDGKVIKNPLGPLANLDELPMQDWSIYEKERFYKPMGGKIWICGPIELTRGCLYRCAFCSNDRLRKIYAEKGRYTRERKVENFISELKLKQKEYGLQYLFLGSENFLHTNGERFNKFIEMYEDIRLPFWVQTRPETLDLKKINRLKAVGCEGISIGIEHGNENFRRQTLNRFVSNDLIIKAFSILRKSGIRVCTNSIVGFPTETRELFFDTVELNRKLNPDNCIINIFCAYRGTKLWELCVEKGYISKDSLAGDYRCDARLEMPQLSSQVIKGLQRTFPLYVKFPRKDWPKIKKAEGFNEEGNEVFEELSAEFKGRFL